MPSDAQPAGSDLDFAVEFYVPEMGEVWLVRDENAAAQLALPPRGWVSPKNVMLVGLIEKPYRLEVLRWMKRMRVKLADVKLERQVERRVQ